MISSNNIAVEDVLDQLGGYGVVSLRKGLFSSGASPHLRGQPELWHLRIDLPGYNSPYASRAYVEVTGASIRDVANAAFQALEDYVFSAQAVEDRQRYERDNAFYAERFEAANIHQRMGHDPVRHPGSLIPPIVWGERRGGFIR